MVRLLKGRVSRVCLLSAVTISFVNITTIQAQSQSELLSPFAVQNSDLSDIPKSMGTFGDSISAGMLANFSRKTANLPWVEAWFILRSLVGGALFKVKGLEVKKLSWSGGIDNRGRVISHARRLAALDPSRKLKVFNVAHSGDEVRDILDTQLPKLQELSRSELGQDFPDYITVLIGANDVCADSADTMTSVDQYYERMDAIFGKVLENSPKTRIMVSTLPNIESLRRVALGARDWGWGPFAKCENVWKAIKLCPTLTTIEDPQERAKIAQRVLDFNDVIRDVAAKYNRSHDDHVHVSESVYKVQFNKDQLSMDCFHPNPTGQNLLSSETWKATWWTGVSVENMDAQIQDRIAMNNRCDSEEMQARANPKINRLSRDCYDWKYRTADVDKTIGSIQEIK